MSIGEHVSSAAFGGVGGRDADTVFDLLGASPRRRLASGAVADPDDFAGAALLVVERGVLALRADIPHRRRGVIACHVTAGAILLPPEPGEVLRVLEEALVLLLPAELRDRLLAVPAAAQIVVDALAATLRQKTRTIAYLSSMHHTDRLRSKLMQLAEDHGRVARDGIRLDLRLTHDLLAEMIGSARETVTRALEELEVEGFVARDGREYLLQLPPDALGPLAGV